MCLPPLQAVKAAESFSEFRKLNPQVDSLLDYDPVDRVMYEEEWLKNPKNVVQSFRAQGYQIRTVKDFNVVSWHRENMYPLICG